ncbi:Metallo-dependent phosphatase-like protein [Microdochium trichocladiopsis]|uniref:Metallo-dependent phosphatase-like protein n=1 Tax=Microdochium trichocladiopsis TaxID=1682393 RepID=A0A9P9BRI9_9PEZI|nr:Metallo-dependent phosphatase-like protein [Microdochium trichocladiopsis]KAH7032966.1 Metallo-dependent phosphatase-like protein [Microdochium trichocladiopsis]
MRVSALKSAVLLVAAATAPRLSTADGSASQAFEQDRIDQIRGSGDADLLSAVTRAHDVLSQLLGDRLGSEPLFKAFDGDFAAGRQRPLEEDDGKGRTTWEDEIWLDAAGPVGCAACEVILAQLKVIAAAGDAFFIGFLSELCKRTGVQDADVCEGSIALEGPIVARGIRSITVGSRVSRLFCAYSVGLCSFPEVESWQVPFPSPKPPPEPSTASRLAGATGQKERREPLRIVHYSDIHVDPFYEQGTNANCTKPICCRYCPSVDSSNSVTDGSFLPAGPHGDHQCDSPLSLEKSMYMAIKDLVLDAAFSIFTGDIVDHAVWNTTQAQNTINIGASYVRMADVGLTVYGTAGNHESSPTNSFPPEGSSDSAQWLYNLLSLAWMRWVGSDAADTARKIGAYSTKHRDLNLRILSLNTNLHYAHNYWLYEDPMQRDPSGQLTWLVRELDAAEKNGERVYIIGHMPMGSGDAFHDGSNYFDQIVGRYSPGTIAGLFFGHTHLDEFELAYHNYSSRSHSGAFATTYVAPSLTPTSGHPSFRVYTVDPETFGVLDITTYRANMDTPDYQAGGALPKWEKYYSARDAYGPLVTTPPLGAEQELTPAFWHNVTEVLERNATAFGEYLVRKRRGWQAEEAVAACDDECARLEICKLRAARAQDNCMTPGSRVNLGRREPPFGDDCESSVVRNTLSNVAVQRELLGWTGSVRLESFEAR